MSLRLNLLSDQHFSTPLVCSDLDLPSAKIISMPPRVQWFIYRPLQYTCTALRVRWFIYCPIHILQCLSWWSALSTSQLYILVMLLEYGDLSTVLSIFTMSLMVQCFINRQLHILVMLLEYGDLSTVLSIFTLPRRVWWFIHYIYFKCYRELIYLYFLEF